MKRTAIIATIAVALLSGCSVEVPDVPRDLPTSAPASTNQPQAPAATVTSWKKQDLRDGLVTVPGTTLVGAVEDRTDGGAPGWFAVLELDDEADINQVVAAFADQLTAIDLTPSTANIDEGVEVNATRTEQGSQTSYDIVVSAGDSRTPGYVAVMAVTLAVVDESPAAG